MADGTIRTLLPGKWRSWRLIGSRKLLLVSVWHADHWRAFLPFCCHRKSQSRRNLTRLQPSPPGLSQIGKNNGVSGTAKAVIGATRATHQSEFDHAKIVEDFDVVRLLAGDRLTLMCDDENGDEEEESTVKVVRLGEHKNGSNTYKDRQKRKGK